MLGEILRDARKAKGYTLKELAAQVEVTPGYLSHLENNRLEPSISLLRRLTETLEITPTVALDSQERRVKAVLVRKEERPTVRYSNLSSEAQLLTPFLWKGAARPRIEAIRMEVPGGSHLSSEPLSVDTDECLYVLEGELEYRRNEEVLALKAGDSLYVPKKTGHWIRNPKEQPAVIVWITHSGEPCS